MAAKGPEVRIGLVLYGGVSLAVYIYGVVIEVQRLLRAARELERGGDLAEMSAYARALDASGASEVTVDIVSGTSAGGINGILLAKALAEGTDVELARQLWLEGGDIDQLLQPPSSRDPRALLRSEHFEEKLREGMRLLSGPPRRDRAAPPPILDLFVSSTHLRGGQRLFADSLGQEIQTRQHRYVFRLKLRRRERILARAQGYERNDFTDNERLVKVARATSAFPAAFEPVEVTGADGLLEQGEADGWFSDGGILNNKPFTEAVEAIVSRRSDRPVRRWLFSIDPDPVPATAADGSAGPEPAFDRIALRAITTIPRYQSIARDLAALQTHNDRVAAAAEMVIAGEAEIAAAGDGAAPGADGPAPGGLGPGPAAAYGVLRRQAWALEIADSVMAAVWVRGDGDVDRAGVHRELRRVAEAAIERYGDERSSDLAFQRRRVYYLIKLLSLADSVSTREGEPADASGPREALWSAFEEISNALWSRFSQRPLPLDPEEQPAAAAALARPRIVAALALGVAFEKRLLDLLGGIVVWLPAPASEPEGTFPVPLADAFREFERRDAMLLPADVYGGLRQRDRIDHAQISPAAATNTEIETERKLAGVSLGHFGGFLDAEWRRNDLMWGRLDGAEVLMRAILAERDEDEVAAFTDEAQAQIVAAELRDSEAAPGNFRAKLEAHVGDGPTPGDLDNRALLSTGLRAAAVVRKMLRTAGNEAAEGGIGNRIRSFALAAAANALAFVLALIYLPATALLTKTKAVRGIVTFLVFFPLLWGVATLLLGFLGLLPLDRVWLPAVVGIAIYPASLGLYWCCSRIAQARALRSS